MAEMTAAAMVEWLTADKAFGQECYSRKQIAALIEQQAQEIAKLKAQLDCGVQEIAEADKEVERLKSQIEFWTTSHEAICKNRDYLWQEIAKKDRMLERAIWVLDRTGSCPKKCDLMRNLCAARACWLAWLEKEAEV